MKLKALALVLLVFVAAFAACSTIAVISSVQTGRNLDFTKVPFLAYASNDTVVTPNGPIDTPGGPT
jgi:hypothetical protein